MVFQQKGGLRGKQRGLVPNKPQNKAQDVDLFDMDSDDDDTSGEEEQPVQKTPQNKTPKAKQVQSDKKVTFQLQGKNTPNKNTPKLDKSATKKQLTPGKTALEKFNGIKNNKLKQESEEEDDDDDDEEADLDMLLGGEDDGDDDDDEEDDDEEDDDDDEEDDDEEDDDESSNKQKANILNKSKNKSPVKNAKQTPMKHEKTPAKNEKTPTKNEKTPSKNEKKTPLKNEMTPGKTAKVLSPKQQSASPEKKSLTSFKMDKRERNLRTLFLGSLPTDIMETEIKELSNDIVHVNIPRGGKYRSTAYAFIEFESEAKAEENFKIIEKRKLRNEPVFVDFAGEKSLNLGKRMSKPEGEINMKKLFVSSLPIDVSIADVAKLFPKAITLILSQQSDRRTATVTYTSEQLAAEEFQGAKNAKLFGKPIEVVFSHSLRKKNNKRVRKQQGQEQKPAKKSKLDVNVESDDDDDDDDED